jgi:hypothetical protein
MKVFGTLFASLSAKELASFARLLERVHKS